MPKKNTKSIQKEENIISKDTMHRKYNITINQPFEKKDTYKEGYTHEIINNILQTEFKSIIYYCFAEEMRTKTSYTHILRLQKWSQIFKNKAFVPSVLI